MVGIIFNSGIPLFFLIFIYALLRILKFKKTLETP